MSGTAAYQEFLAGKRAVVPSVGFDVAVDAIHPMLFPFQRDIVRWALHRGRAALFSECGCVAPDTLIDGPDGAERIDVLAARGEPIRVWALNDDGETVEAWASAPFCKGIAPLYQFTLASGRSITVTADHRFLTPEGWQPASSLRVGMLVVASVRWFPANASDQACPDARLRSSRGSPVTAARADHGAAALRSSRAEFLAKRERGAADRRPGYALSHRPSSSVPGRVALHADDPRSVQIHAGSRDRYSPASRQYDPQPQWTVDSARVGVPSLAGVPGRSRACLLADARADGSGHSHLCPASGHPSMRDSRRPACCADRDAGCRGASSHSRSRPSILEADPRFAAFASPLRSSDESDRYQPALVVGQSAYPYLDTVSCIEYITTGPYYDLHVPVYENYLAHGVWNHNTGKTPMQLAWAEHVCRHTGGNVLILAPLAVAEQTVREGEKFSITVHHNRSGADIQPGITITNYERLHLFCAEDFAGLVLDESSILKSFDGSTRRAITAFARAITYRLACTATPAPNDLIELTNHAEFLDILSGKEIIALFFTQDGNTTHAWRLKGHARRDFWRWLASWAVALRRPSDLGYEDAGFILPPLRVHQHTVEAPAPTETLFPVEALTLMDRRKARRASRPDRVAAAAALVNGSVDQWIVWCDLNEESKALAAAIPDAVEVTGSDSAEHKEQAARGFVAGRIRVLATKPSIFGFGLNLQNCHRMTFVGLSDSWEQFYQAKRRCWRFGQTEPVDCHIITAETEGAVVKNIERKEGQAAEMMDELVRHMAGLSLGAAEHEEMDYREDVATGNGWTLYLGDCVERMDEIATESVGLAIYSPPFPGMYAYTNSVRDMGNVRDIGEMIAQFRFLIVQDKLYRVLMPGRTCAIHLTQAVAFKGTDGYIGLKDFRGAVIRVMEEAGWVYYGEVCIDKDPQVKAVRTKDAGLQFKSLANDAARMHAALADYLLQFRKPGENPVPIRAGISEKYGNPNGWMTNDDWIEWAAPVWYGAHRGLPGGIRESDVLNVAAARDANDERHLAPLQLGVIERAVKLWSAPGDLVLSPFAGIGSEGYQAVKLGRRFVGIELKPSYFQTAIGNLRRAEHEAQQRDLFSLAAAENGLQGLATRPGASGPSDGLLDAATGLS